MHPGDHHCISFGKISVTKPVKMASSSKRKSINENKFQPQNNVFCGWRSQENYNCNLCFLLFLSHICVIQGQVNSLLGEWSAAREPYISKVGPRELPLWCFLCQRQQGRFPLFRLSLATMWRKQRWGDVNSRLGISCINTKVPQFTVQNTSKWRTEGKTDL